MKFDEGSTWNVAFWHRNDLSEVSPRRIAIHVPSKASSLTLVVGTLHFLKKNATWNCS